MGKINSLNSFSNPLLASSDFSEQSRMTSQARLRVLVWVFDLFAPSSVGGGQTSYKQIIERSPQTDFYYFGRKEKAHHLRPSNAHLIPWVNTYFKFTQDLPRNHHHFYDNYFMAYQSAAAVKAAMGACSFDVVDTPDFETIGLFIKPALEKHGIKIDRTALAVHGTISSALKDQWGVRKKPSRTLAELRIREHLQYRVADLRYALSLSYANELEAPSLLPSRLIDPLHMVGAFAPRMASREGKVRVLFMGRRERRKGPDIFLDMVWGLNPESYDEALLVGGEAKGDNGVGSDDVINHMAALRGLNICIQHHLTPEERDVLFSQRTVVVVPSRYDQFNLVALEALRLGCPVLVSCHAGVADWIRENCPELSFLIIDITCARTSVAALRNVLLDYDGVRATIVKALAKRNLAVDNSLSTMYSSQVDRDKKAQQAISTIWHRFESFNRPRDKSMLPLKMRAKVEANERLRLAARTRLAKDLDKMLGKRGLYGKLIKPAARSARRRAIRQFGEYKLRWERLANLYETGRAAVAAPKNYLRLRRDLLHKSEATQKDISDKLRWFSKQVPWVRTGRVHLFKDMVRLERQRGQDLIAATYALRLMRWHGRDIYGDLPFAEDTLRAHGFVHEADAASAMFGPQEEAFDRCADLLKSQYQRHLSKTVTPHTLLDDRRGNAAPRVAVIASLYNAESKLRTLIDNMRIQSITQAGRLELVLVDGGSPTNEYAVFKELADHYAIPMVYVRAPARETIQASWNRGIHLARAPYLCFLGVDEGLHPDALSILAQKLDENPNVDWVMADSVVTQVDKKGIFAGDVMAYDRAGYDPKLVYLETCYLSWVGGLYRKSIHDRVGYYDETFRAAGDTEFKGRVLRHINTLHVPKMLGVFNNYPEERTTQHPRAEIEDLRAWYLHRTPAGIAYSFNGKPLKEVIDLFRMSLGYRKSFCRHISTDFDMAAAVAAYVANRGEDLDLAKKMSLSVDRLLGVMNSMETLEFRLSPKRRKQIMIAALEDLRAYEGPDQAAFSLSHPPRYELFNDNRFEQHWWSWSA